MRQPSLVVLAVCHGALPVLAQQHAPRTAALAVTTSTSPQVTFTLRWPNSWRNDRNHDGAWVVLRGPDATRGPLRLAAAGHAATGEVAATVVPSADRLGAFVAPAAPHRGDVAWQVALDPARRDL